MIIGIGVDIVQIPRFEAMISRRQQDSLAKIFIPSELTAASDFSTIKGQASCLAKRFAAKEAFVKALGTGFRAGSLWLKDVYIVNGSDRSPQLELTERAKELCIAKVGSLPKVFVSLSDDYPVAIAQVLLSL